MQLQRLLGLILIASVFDILHGARKEESQGKAIEALINQHHDIHDENLGSNDDKPGAEHKPSAEHKPKAKAHDKRQSVKAVAEAKPQVKAKAKSEQAVKAVVAPAKAKAPAKSTPAGKAKAPVAKPKSRPAGKGKGKTSSTADSVVTQCCRHSVTFGWENTAMVCITAPGAGCPPDLYACGEIAVSDPATHILIPCSKHDGDN